MTQHHICFIADEGCTIKIAKKLERAMKGKLNRGKQWSTWFIISIFLSCHASETTQGIVAELELLGTAHKQYHWYITDKTEIWKICLYEISQVF